MTNPTRMVQRRSEGRSAPQKFLDEVRYFALDWPGKTVSLERRSLDDYCQRSVSGRLSVAEFYHENSKLFREMLPELAATRTDTNGVKLEFLRRRSASVNAALHSISSLPATYRELLSSVSKSIDPALHYSMEMRMLADGVLAVHEPLLDTLYAIKRVTPMELDALAEALEPIEGPKVPWKREPVLFVVGSFAHNDLLYGQRGYRRTLLEIGRVTDRLLQEAERLGLKVKLRLEFMDRAIDALLEADGIEEGVVAALEFGQTSDAG